MYSRKRNLKLAPSFLGYFFLNIPLLGGSKGYNNNTSKKFLKNFDYFLLASSIYMDLYIYQMMVRVNEYKCLKTGIYNNVLNTNTSYL